MLFFLVFVRRRERISLLLGLPSLLEGKARVVLSIPENPRPEDEMVGKLILIIVQ
jgi:hypothetical protein